MFVPSRPLASRLVHLVTVATQYTDVVHPVTFFLPTRRYQPFGTCSFRESPFSICGELSMLPASCPQRLGSSFYCHGLDSDFKTTTLAPGLGAPLVAIF